MGAALEKINHSPRSQCASGFVIMTNFENFPFHYDKSIVTMRSRMQGKTFNVTKLEINLNFCLSLINCKLCSWKMQSSKRQLLIEAFILLIYFHRLAMRIWRSRHRQPPPPSRTVSENSRQTISI